MPNNQLQVIGILPSGPICQKLTTNGFYR